MADTKSSIVVTDADLIPFTIGETVWCGVASFPGNVSLKVVDIVEYRPSRFMISCSYENQSGEIFIDEFDPHELTHSKPLEDYNKNICQFGDRVKSVFIFRTCLGTIKRIDDYHKCEVEWDDHHTTEERFVNLIKVGGFNEHYQ